MEMDRSPHDILLEWMEDGKQEIYLEWPSLA